MTLVAICLCIPFALITTWAILEEMAFFDKMSR